MRRNNENQRKVCVHICKYKLYHETNYVTSAMVLFMFVKTFRNKDYDVCFLVVAVYELLHSNGICAGRGEEGRSLHWGDGDDPHILRR